MPIAVVVTRDDVGAPTTREIYAHGDRYRIGDGNLQVLSADSRVLALYGSGNWLSAYVAGTVTVTSMGKDCSLGAVSAAEGGSAAPDAPEEEAPGGGDLFAADPVVHEAVADEAPADEAPADEAAAAQLGGDAVAVRHGSVPGPGALPDPVPAVARKRAADAETDSIRPGWMPPVVFRPHKLAATRPAQDPPDAPRGMRTVAFRPKTFVRGTAAEPPAPARDPGPRPVVFRRRTYRPVLIETDPASEDAEPDSDG